LNILKNIAVIILLLLMIPLPSVWSQKTKGRSKVREIRVPEGLSYDVMQYRKGDFPRAGQMAIAYKDDGQAKKPVVVFIHGGGWANGDKDNVAYQIFQVAQKGFVGVSVSYRLISEAPFPTCIEDVKQAIRFLKSKEDVLPIDVERIGVWGYSAGAHLALMLGLSPSHLYQTDTLQSYNTSVKSLMVVSTPIDFVTRRNERGYLNWMSEAQNNNEDFLKEVSPLSYVHKKQIPVYMLHGTADSIVKPVNYIKFERECQLKRVDNFKLYEFEGGTHMFYFKQRDLVRPVFQDFLKGI